MGEKASLVRGGLCPLQIAHDYATILPTKARVFYDKNLIRLPWQQSMDLEKPLEPQGLFGICASNLHHFYTTHFVTIFQSLD